MGLHNALTGVPASSVRSDRVRRPLLVAAWSAAVAIVVLTGVPPNLRPTTDAPHGVEHAAAFLIVGILFGLAYAGRERILCVGAVVFCAMIEVLQIYNPGGMRAGSTSLWTRWRLLPVFLRGPSSASLFKSANPSRPCYDPRKFRPGRSACTVSGLVPSPAAPQKISQSIKSRGATSFDKRRPWLVRRRTEGDGSP
jgi:hypothetical protein